MRLRRMVPTLVLTGFLTLACGGMAGTPPSNPDMIGVWSGPGVTLNVAPGGHIDYSTNTGASSFSYNGPVQKWEPSGFTYGIFGVQSTATVVGPTQDADGTWHMTVDGVELTRN